jgi:hypothetical protein
VVDVRTNQVVLRVRGGATGIWPTELLFDRIGTPYLASGTASWPATSLSSTSTATIRLRSTVFDGDMCRRQYNAPARGKPAVSSSSSDEDDQ